MRLVSGYQSATDLDPSTCLQRTFIFQFSEEAYDGHVDTYKL
jgi:hypothetical protein